MASNVRKRFELDERVLTEEQNGAISTIALKEVKRKVKLNRSRARHHNTVYNTLVWKGFESQIRRHKKSLLNLSMLKAQDLISIVSFWLASKSSAPELAF